MAIFPFHGSFDKQFWCLSVNNLSELESATLALRLRSMPTSLVSP